LEIVLDTGISVASGDALRIAAFVWNPGFSLNLHQPPTVAQVHLISLGPHSSAYIWQRMEAALLRSLERDAQCAQALP
jgi:hypothetical protein